MCSNTSVGDKSSAPNSPLNAPDTSVVIQAQPQEVTSVHGGKRRLLSQPVQEKGEENEVDDTGIQKSLVFLEVSRVLSGCFLQHPHIDKDSGVDSRVVRDTSQAGVCSALTRHEQEEDSPEQIFAVLLQQAQAEVAEEQRAALQFGRSGLGAAFGYAEQPELAERSRDPYTEKNRGRTLEDKEEDAAQNRNLILAPLHFLQSNSPDCEDESLYAAETCAGIIASHCVLDRKRVPLAPLQSSSIKKGWVCWRDASGDIVMAEKQRSSGSGAKEESSDASASDAQKDESEEDFVTITGACL